MDLSLETRHSIVSRKSFDDVLNISSFLDRTTFEAFESMPLFLNLGFAFGAFDKNAIFYSK